MDGVRTRFFIGTPDGRPPLWRRVRLPLLVGAMSLPLLAPSLHTYDLGRQAATDAVLAVALCIPLGFCGRFSVGHAALYGVGAYTAAILIGAHDVDPLVALLAAVGAGAVAGTALGLPALRVRGDQLAILTLFAGGVAQQVFLNATSVTGPMGVVSGLPDFVVFGHDLIPGRDTYLCACAALIVAVVVADLVRRSPLGIAMAGARDDEVAARSSGVRVGLVTLVAFAISGGLCGLAGWCDAGAVGLVTPSEFSTTLSVLVAVMVLAGGGRVEGAVLGAGLVLLVQDLTSTASGVEDGVTGMAIVLVVMGRSGVFGECVRAIRARLPRPAMTA